MSDRLTAKQLQARLVHELGDDYRYTDRTLREWARRPTDPLPSQRDGPRGHITFDWDQVLEWLEQEADRQEGAAPPEWTASLAAGVLLTPSAVARELDMAPATIIARLRNWNIRPAETRKAKGQHGEAHYYRLRDIIDALTASARAEDPDALPAVERDAYYRSELRKDELRRQRGELIETDDARRVFGALVQLLAHDYDLIPDILEHKANLGPTALDAVQQYLDEAREERARSIVDLQTQLTAPAREDDAPINATTGAPKAEDASRPRANAAG
jgi:hypothetical protein